MSEVFLRFTSDVYSKPCHPRATDKLNIPLPSWYIASCYSLLGDSILWPTGAIIGVIFRLDDNIHIIHMLDLKPTSPAADR